MKFGNEVSRRLGFLEKTQQESKNEQATTKQTEKLVEVDLTLPDMRPPSSNTKTLLYTGISAHGEGRKAYLAREEATQTGREVRFSNDDLVQLWMENFGTCRLEEVSSC